HDVAELPGELHLAGSEHARRLDEEDLAAHARPRQAGAHAGLLGSLGDVARVATRAQKFAEVLFRLDLARSEIPLRDLDRDAANDAGDLPLERAPAGFTRVAVDD